MPQLLIIRHAIAESPEHAAAAGRSEFERCLTRQGRSRMHEAAKGLRRVVDGIDVLASSPLVRARETAAIVGEAFAVEVEIIPALAPGGDRTALLHWFRVHDRRASCAIVGHEPDLGNLASWLLTGGNELRLSVKKGAALLIDFRGEPAPGCGELAWLLPLKVLRALA